MDPQLKEILVAWDLVQIETSDKAAEAVLAAWFKARGIEQPKSVEETLAAMLKPDEPAAKGEQPKTSAGTDESGGEDVTAESGDPAGDGKQTLAERQRQTDIRARGKLLKVDATTIEQALDSGQSVEDFSAAAIKKAAEAETPLGKVEAGRPAADKFHGCAVAALEYHAGVTDQEPEDATAREMAYESLLEIAKRSLRAHGQRPIGDPDQIAGEALSLHAYERAVVVGATADRPIHTPGTFAGVLSALAGKMLMGRDRFAETTFQNWAYRIADVPDFKPKTIYQMGEFPELPFHPDGEDFEQSTMGSEMSWIAVESYGDECIFTPRMLVDDDLGAFMDALVDKDDAHDATLNRLCVGLLTGNVTMVDGNSLFDDTNHGNDVTAGAAPSTAELDKIRKKFRKQKGVSAKRNLNLTLRRLLVPEDIETTTQQLLSATLQINPTQESATPVFKGQVAYDVEPMLGEHSAAKYYGFATIARARAIIYTYQRGYRRMVVRRYYNPKTNSLHYQCEGRFAAAARNYRGVVRNAGTGA